MPLAGLESTTGTTIEAVVGEPATFDAAGFKAMAGPETIVGIVSFGEWGDTENDVTEALLTEGRQIHQNGLSDGGEVAFGVQHRTTDAGADLVRNNSGGSQIMTIIKTYPSGDKECASGVFTSPRQRAAENDSIRGFTSNFRVNTQVYEFTAAVWAAA